MAGFGFLVGGALEGYGKSKLDQAVAKREAALEETRWQRQMIAKGQEKTDRREEQATLADAKLSAAEKLALANRDVVTNADGTTGLLDKGSATTQPVKNPDGTPLIQAASTDKLPMEAKMAKYLVTIGAAPDEKSAYTLMQQGTVPQISDAQIYKMAQGNVKAQAGSFGGKQSSEDYQAAIKVETDAIRSFLGQDKDAPAVKVTSQAQVTELDVGTRFIAPNGTQYEKTGPNSARKIQ